MKACVPVLRAKPVGEINNRIRERERNRFQAALLHYKTPIKGLKSLLRALNQKAKDGEDVDTASNIVYHGVEESINPSRPFNQGNVG
ncbi:MAG: hypothetical protein V3S64_06535 [bacterium]